MEEAHRAHDVLRAHRRAFNEAAVKSGEVILRTWLLINGRAAIAVLAFMGNVIAKDPSSHGLLADCLRRAERLLFWGGFAVIAMGLMGGGKISIELQRMFAHGDALCRALGQYVDKSQERVAGRVVWDRRQGFGQFRIGLRERRDRPRRRARPLSRLCAPIR